MADQTPSPEEPQAEFREWVQIADYRIVHPWEPIPVVGVLPWEVQPSSNPPRR